jgi:hypothetical protein
MGFLILTGIVGLGIGIWLGMPGRYTQSADDIQRIMETGGARRRKSKRMFTPMAWLQRRAEQSVTQDRRRRTGSSGFKLESPEDRDNGRG